MVFGSKKKPFVLKTREEREADIAQTERLRARARPPKSPVKPIVSTGRAIATKGKSIAGTFRKKEQEDPTEQRLEKISYELEKGRLEKRHKKETQALENKYAQGKIDSKTFQTERNELLKKQSLEREQFELENM